MNLEKQIGNKLRKERKKAGYTSAESFAFENEIGRSQYQAYEKGDVKMRVDTLHKILKALNISLEDFFKGIK